MTESQFEILRAAECPPDTSRSMCYGGCRWRDAPPAGPYMTRSIGTPALPRHDAHHELVSKAASYIVHEEKQVGGQLGRPSGARFRVYERLKNHAERVKDTLFDTEPLRRAIDDIYRYPLRQAAVDALNRQLRSGVSDQALAELVIALRDEDRLCLVHDEDETQEPRLICSMGLIEH